jgi:pimeloyl-ACP methyl ester carboxylesterase
MQPILSQSITVERGRPGPAALPSERLEEVAVDGLRVRYSDVGTGAPVLLLHGYPQNHRCWRHQVGALARGHRVIAPDWPGWGQSERSFRHAVEYSLEVDRIGLLLDRLHLERVTLVGHDYGGFLGLGFVIRHPRRVERLALINTRAHRTFSSATYPLFWAQRFAACRPWLKWIFQCLPLGSIHRLLLRRHVAQGCFDERELDDYVGWLDRRDGRLWLAHFNSHYDPVPRPELARGLSAIRCPTAVIWGDRDPYLPFSIAEELARGIGGARLYRVAGADHYVMEERPDEVTAALAELLALPMDRDGRYLVNPRSAP